ncbi:DsbC family protein [Alteraurantiacibacter buctensis]|uniref:Thiol:disulfide interchange protein n=1 Tax=Alteraurantiacibacter buctensis TaxID=1503981 RepID=A0A844Z092_9SPHN|nr:DsbC family protein [Alteraurantiacibacter buctensis]MXO71777.1 thioredoxin fold domain-containing protein [Alteraurantiacibacter buctensis]
MTYSNHTPGLKARLTHMALAATGAATVLTIGLGAVTAMPASARDDAVETALKLRLPKTPVDALTCDGLGPWCEVVSGDTLFYIDKAARYLFVGRLYDMEQRSDLTAARLLELNPDLIAAGGARAQATDKEGAKEKPQGPEQVDLSGLPAEGAIRWGNPDGPKLVVFSDFQCGYCKRLAGELAKAGVLVEERPISIFGKESRDLSEAVTCAGDPVAALHEAYEGRAPQAQHKCPGVRGLDANEAFARANGFAGTPVIVRASDGAVLHGFRDADTLRAFAAGGKEKRK